MPEQTSFMDLIDPRAHAVIDDYLNSLIVSGDLHLRDLDGFEFVLYEHLTPLDSFFRASSTLNEKCSDVPAVKLRPLFDDDEWKRMDELFIKSVRDVLNIDVTPEPEAEEKK